MSQLHFLGRQMIGAVAFSNKAPEEYERAEEIFLKSGDHLGRAAWNALKKVRAPNPVALAEQMSRLGHAGATADLVNAEILSLATRWTLDGIPVLPGPVYRQLCESYDQVAGEEKFQHIVDQLRLHRITLHDAADQAAAIAGNSVERPDAFTDSTGWNDNAEQYMEQRRILHASNKILSWPPVFATLAHNIAEIEPGILAALIAQSGVGKSLFVSQIVDHWAIVHKHNVLNCSTELPPRVMLWRRITKYSKDIRWEDLNRGTADKKKVEDALMRYRGAGLIRDYMCAGRTVDDIVKQALPINAHIFIDYFDMLDLSRSKMFGKHFDSNKTDAVGYALTTLKEYATSQNRVVWVVLQTGKEAAPKFVDGRITGEQTLRLENGMDSVRFKHRANLGISLNFKIVETPRMITAPLSKVEINDRPGTYSCIGEGIVVKDSFTGKEGLRFPLFRDGPRSAIYEFDSRRLSNAELPNRPPAQPAPVDRVETPEKSGGGVSRAVPERREDFWGPDGD